MSNPLAAVKFLVKGDAGEALRHGVTTLLVARDWSSSTLAERIEWVRSFVADPETGKRPISERALSLAAGLSGSQVWQWKRSNAGAVKSLEKLSDYLTSLGFTDVTVDWLGTGKGSPLPPGEESGPVLTLDPDDRYPSRPGALAYVRARGISEETIEWCRSVRLDSDNADPGELFWVDRMLAHEKELKALGKIPAREKPPREGL